MKPSDRAIATAFREYHGGPAFEAATRRIENRAAEIQRDLDAQPSEWPEADATLYVYVSGRRALSCSAAFGQGNHPLYTRPTVERLLADLRAENASLRAQWSEAYSAFKGAFDTPAAWRRDDSEYAHDARKRLREFNEAMIAAPEPAQAKENSNVV